MVFGICIDTGKEKQEVRPLDRCDLLAQGFTEKIGGGCVLPPFYVDKAQSAGSPVVFRVLTCVALEEILCLIEIRRPDTIASKPQKPTLSRGFPLVFLHPVPVFFW